MRILLCRFCVFFVRVIPVSGSVKKKGAWRGGYFPKYNVTVAYHRAVLLADYRWEEPKQSAADNKEGLKGAYRVDVDIPAGDWVNIINFYDILVLNSGHWWGSDEFPKEKPLIFYHCCPPLWIMDGFKVVLEIMVMYIEREFPRKTLKFWRLQSPRHFHGGEWNQMLDLWFDPSNNGVNKEARQVNLLIREALQGSSVQVLDLTHLSEFRAEKKDAVAIWGQDRMHWCLPGVPNTWVDILSELIRNSSVSAQ